MRKSFASPVLTFSDRSTQRTQLVLGQVAVGAGLEHSELHTADGDTAQSADLKAYCGAHAAYLAVSALLDDEAEHRSFRGSDSTSTVQGSVFTPSSSSTPDISRES